MRLAALDFLKRREKMYDGTADGNSPLLTQPRNAWSKGSRMSLDRKQDVGNMSDKSAQLRGFFFRRELHCAAGEDKKSVLDVLAPFDPCSRPAGR